MAWLYVPGSEGSNLESSSLSPAIEQSVTWRGKSRPLRSWSVLWGKASFLRHLSGLTSPPSILSRGVASWISSLRASRVNRGASRDSELEQPTSDGSGMTSNGSFAWFDRASSTWRTYQGSLFEEGLTPFSADWPSAGWMQSGACSVLELSAPHIDERGSSSWPTATETDSRSSARTTTATGVKDSGPTLTDAIRQWATPVARDHRSGRGQQKRLGSTALNEQASQWLTPTAEPYGSSQNGICKNKPSGNTLSLERLSRSFHPDQETQRPGGALPLGRTSARLWKTPHGIANIDKSGKVAGAGGEFHKQVMELTGSPKKSSLNPLFVEWLMGWPIGWTGSECSATELSHYRRRMRSALWRLLLR